MHYQRRVHRVGRRIFRAQHAQLLGNKLTSRSNGHRLSNGVAIFYSEGAGGKCNRQIPAIRPIKTVYLWTVKLSQRGVKRKEKSVAFYSKNASPITIPKALEVNDLSMPSSMQSSAESSYTSMLSVISSFCKVFSHTSYLPPMCPHLTKDSLSKTATVRSKNVQKLSCGHVRIAQIFLTRSDKTVFVVVDVEVCHPQTGAPGYFLLKIPLPVCLYKTSKEGWSPD